MFKKITALSLCACLVLISGCAAKDDGSKIIFVLDWTPNTNHTGIYVAKDLGYYADEGLEIDIIQPPEAGALSLLATGKADFAVSFQEEVTAAANAEAPLPVVAIAALLEHNTGGLLSLKESGITRFKDMEGKSYGSWQIPVYDEIVRECIRADGGDPDNVEFLPNSATDSISGIRHDFDAVWVYEGWEKLIAEINGIETNFIAFRDAAPVFDYYTPVLATSRNNLENNPEMVKKFMRATEKGYSYAKENPAAAADILLKFAPETDGDIIHASQEFLSAQYFSEKWGYIDEKRWNDFFDWMKEKGMLSESADVLAFENIDY